MIESQEGKRSGASRQDWYRLARVVGSCLFLAAIVLQGLTPVTRSLTLFLLAAIFSLAAVYELSMREAPERWMIFSVGPIFAMAAVACCALDYFLPLKPDAQGPLIAANDPPQKMGCSGPKTPVAKNDLVMMFGTDRVIGKGSGPFVPVRIGTCPALAIRRTAGGLLVNAFGYDSGDDVVYRIENNVFHMILRGFSREHRPDASTLIVSDDNGTQSFFLRFMNRNTVKMRGTFRCGDTDPVVIGDDMITIGGRPTIGHACATIDARAPYGIEYSGRAP